MPSMPLSGVRISWLTMARKRDLARLAASAWSRASPSARSACDAVGDVAADALRLGARASLRTATSRQAIQRAPSAAAIFWSWARVPSASTATSPCSTHGKSDGCADQLAARLARQRAEGVVGIGDAALRVAAHDQVALRLEQAVRALFRFAQFPIAVGQFLGAHFDARIFSLSMRPRINMNAMAVQAAANSEPTPLA